MQKNKLHSRRVKSLILVFSLTTIVLSVATYAWFIGLRTVSVTNFDVQIKTADSLMLSLDGDSWTNTLQIDKDSVLGAYTNDTNWWTIDPAATSTGGLIPMSTTGVIDKTASRLTLFEKASLTSTDGGYRLLTSRVGNFEALATEQPGYIAFDLFVMNLSGREYYNEVNINNEEGIYLTTDSSVIGSTTGVAGAGIENSMRIAFAQIGRLQANADGVTAANYQGITCATNEIAGEPATPGLCENRDATIWEPNDTKHVANAISWYDTTCVKRSDEVGTEGEYITAAGNECTTLVNGAAKTTYAISREITIENTELVPFVDIYDGADLNGYTGSTSGATPFLESMDYFTDTEKAKTGTLRPEFMYLAPNSVTKIRVYIFLEGQDVDNYDFAQIGKAVTIKFGFTKERMEESDFEYLTPVNPETPVIELTPSDNTVPETPVYSVTLTVGDTYTEYGVTNAYDKELGVMVGADETALVDDVEINASEVNTNVAGSYKVYYTLRDSSGNTTTVVRNVTVNAAG